ncbi:MAG TPA: DEAD/DEAH box helicase [Gemmatimonadales bacterium]|nr:DEAD/DEAH box helicase [Gemmatimonadales bacterium]
MTSPFAELGLGSALIESLTALGYEEPTPIQREAIPPLLEGRDLLGQAATGTGKTAAFALPLIQTLPDDEPQPGRPAIVVLVPTRELAMQVAEAFHRYGRSRNARVVPIYGGQAFDQQIRALRRGVHVVVATPGRALDHLRRGTLDFSALSAVVLDEADEMLDMGFAEEIEALLEAAPAERQTALFSATMPSRIAAIAERHLRRPVRVQIAREKAAHGEVPRVRQTAYIVARAQKVPALGRVLDLEAPGLAVIFCRTRTEVDMLAETLSARGYRAEALHGGMTQEQRDRVMKRTRTGAIDLLIATDVAARGLDIEQLTHVVNFDVPPSPAAYVHRIGRTGRAGREGVAITLAEPREHRLLRNIEQHTRQRIQIATVPTVLDVRARRLELTRASLREAILAGDLDGYRSVVEGLAGEFDVMDVAAAAVKLIHAGSAGASDADEDDEIPSSEAADGRRARGRPKPEGKGRSGTPAREARAGMVRIYVGAGRKNNMRPADLVGAIANESGIDARGIGAIEIADSFSLVELPAELADQVIAALRATKLKGKRLTVRRDQARSRGPTAPAGKRPASRSRSSPD